MGAAEATIETQPVFQISYVSSAAKDVKQEQIEAILNVARATNPGLGITGVLLYRGGIFLQLLEGPEDKVTDLYKKIEKDPRHTNVIKLFEEHKNPRIYTDWSMAYKELNDLDLKLVNEILSWNKLISAAKTIDNHLIMHLFSRFKKHIEG